MKMFSTADAAERLGVTVARVQALIWEGRLPAQMVGRDYIIQEEDLKLVENRQAGRPSAQLYREYWPPFKERLEGRESFMKLLRQRRGLRELPQPLRERYYKMGLRGDCRIAANILVNDRQMWVDITFGKETRELFSHLQEQRGVIDKELRKALEFPEQVEWHQPPNRKESFILVRKQQVDVTDQKDWPEQHDWLCRKFEAFYRAFEPRVLTR
jgi:excisionase family DNA binding protein